MTGKVGIVTDSTADLNTLAGDDITVVPLIVTFGAETFRDGVDLDSDQFYDRLIHGKHHPTTSQPPPGAFEEAYRRLFEGGAERIISLHISASLSGTYNSAVLASQNVDPARITVIDTRTASAGLGLLALGARDQAARGDSFDAIVAKARADIPNDQLFAAIPTLTYLARGGRIGPLQSMLGNVLQIVPIITLKDGVIAEQCKVRTFTRAVDQLIELTVARIPTKKTARLGVLHAVAPELAAKVAARLQEQVEPVSIISCCAGPTVGTHAGPGAVGVFFIP